MKLMINIDENQTKVSAGKLMWEHNKAISPEKHDSSRKEGMSSLPKGEWTVA